MKKMETGANVVKSSLKEEAKGFIPKIASADDIYRLFQLLKYPDDKLFDSSYKRDISEFEFKKEEREKIKAIYTVFSYEKDLPIFLMETTTTSHTFLKYVTKVLADRYLRFLLILTSDYEELVFVLPDYERVETGKHKLRISKLVLDKDDLYYTDLETIVQIAFEGEESWRDLWKKWRQAFDVEKVTERFFLDYQETFFKVRSTVVKQKIATKDAHEFTLQLLNRIMFIYFVSKKRWLKNDPKFMRWLWKRYLLERNTGKAAKDSFYSNWLTIVFFEAFNNRFRNNTPLPDDVKKVFRDAPYLNGGLFRKGDLDNLSVRISDELFKGVFEFFERYNFTIREDLLDAEVAVDPQMIGYVYESLANVAESSYEREEDLRGAWGIFYTPRIEVEFMCKRALVEYLANHMPQVPKEKLYEFVFDDDKEKAEVFFEKEGLWYDLEDFLDSISVVDPACGSGAFLVGMVNVLSELYRIIYRHMKRDLTDFELKNKIIMRSLYGVDVMPWAVHAAELRLWLQLIVESDLRPDDLKAHPLLPNLNMNLRIGDSLVQEIGGINLHVRDPAIGLKLKQRLLELKTEKEKYFNNEPTAKFKIKEDLQREEIRIFAEVIKDRLTGFSDEQAKLSKKLQELERGVQKDLYGNVTETPDKEIEPVKNQLFKVDEEIATLNRIAESLRDPEKKPFVWEIGFAEIFGGKGGFDIVIGNPPYVRSHGIAPPNIERSSATLQARQLYKTKLLASIRAHFGEELEVDKISDLYVYFYFHGLSLLGPKGVLCFITSNSWLDVGYGKNFQEFLLKYAPIVGIYDNSAKRSFAHADVNTVIVLIGAPLMHSESTLLDFVLKRENPATKWPALSNISRFIMFKKPIEEVLSARNLVDIERTDHIITTDQYRVCPVKQETLLEDGWEYSNSSKALRFGSGSYSVGKWGGKYLKAPDIYLSTIINRQDILDPLESVAKVQLGITSGNNSFFYLTTERVEQLRIEKRFLLPLLKGPKEIQRVRGADKVELWLFCPNKQKSAIKGTNALRYIISGEKNGIHEAPFFKNRPAESWYYQSSTVPDLVHPYDNWIRHFCAKNPTGFVVDKHLVCITIRDNALIDEYCMILNSTFLTMERELMGRTNFGEGLLETSVNDCKKLLVINPQKLTSKDRKRLTEHKESDEWKGFCNRQIGDVFGESGIDPTKPIRDQTPAPPKDRKKLDDVVFDILGLEVEARKEVYWSVCELVKARLDKAKSLMKGD
jgi:type I restriction-modification system DNA methylase subunit